MSDKKVNIVQLAEWIIKATQNNKGFILKPSDLKMLYIIMLWEYLSKHYDGKKLINDEQISIPEKDLIKLIEIFYTKSNNTYFGQLFNTF